MIYVGKVNNRIFINNKLLGHIKLLCKKSLHYSKFKKCYFKKEESIFSVLSLCNLITNKCYMCGLLYGMIFD